MGGGDLNLKKSWHPHTLKNQEKVWKAEQAKQAEDNKLADLRREIEEERNREELTRIGQNSGVLARGDGDKKLEWMYKSSTDLINRDEYLLGRKIDKSFEILQAEEKAAKTDNVVGIKQQINHVEHECVPFSIRSYKNAQSTEQVDMQRKVMEDPLMLIKQKEIESRRKLLENPVKLKELHRILKTEQMLKKAKEKSKKSKSKSAKKSKKKHKNKKRKSKQSSSDSDSSSASDDGGDLDKKLEKQYKKLQGDSGDIVGMSLSKLLNAKYDTISKELDKAVKTKKKKRQGSSESEQSDSDDSSAFKNQRSGNQSQRFDRTERRRSAQRDIKRRSRSGSRSNNRQNAFNRRPRSRSPYRRQQARSRSGSPYRNNRRFNNNRSQYNNESNRRLYQDRHRQEQQRERSSSPERRQGKRSNEGRGSPERRQQQQQRPRERSQSTERRQRNRSRERSRSVEKRQRKRSLERSESPRRRNRSITPAKPKPNNSTQRHRSRSNSQPPRKRSPQAPSSKQGSKLTAEEKAAKLREMMENANWREDDRTKAVKKHREAYAKEEEQHNAREFDKEFINKEAKKALNNYSNVGTRIRANLNNIQRTASAMDANFARK